MLRFLFFILVSLFSRLAGAVDATLIRRPDGTIGELANSSTSIIANIISYAIGLTAVLGVIGITWGGIQMILSVGEDEKLKKARKIIIYSIVGVAIAGLAYGVVRLIGNFRI